MRETLSWWVSVDWEALIHVGVTRLWDEAGIHIQGSGNLIIIFNLHSDSTFHPASSLSVLLSAWRTQVPLCQHSSVPVYHRLCHSDPVRDTGKSCFLLKVIEILSMVLFGLPTLHINLVLVTNCTSLEILQCPKTLTHITNKRWWYKYCWSTELLAVKVLIDFHRRHTACFFHAFISCCFWFQWIGTLIVTLQYLVPTDQLPI